ncbi:ATP-binding cassette domain-containing protein [Agrobacterium sp. B1(2019)]|uniref:ABC transporter ATP-binding protein n=1 Tax=Agrobacterium sp. B1(2019) TaxID=2607032 RepID=UPI0011EEEE11|nr:ATP-binding cassette domain-containing protein [Agrobacterium sp. B1(2019)]TZG33392.1 ATP-binding cassette domain-containing protein [Agrobacterium sp. B1(2019)]
MNQSISIRELKLNYGTVEVLKNLNLDIGKGEFLVLLGSSGCGKSTLLNCIAGLIEPTDGQIFINDRNVTWEEPSKRGIGMVFQSYALYPQMTVAGNLSFGLKNAGVAKDVIAERIKNAASVLQIEPLLERKPSALSGGQRQRVAIGRALVRDVDVFLFDEPLSNLDAKLRADLRVEIKRLHQKLGNTMIYVTHDQVEAMTLADRIAVMKGGSVMQLATPQEIYNTPANKYVADFIGSPSMNFFQVGIDGSALHFGDLRVPLDGYSFCSDLRPKSAWLGVRPEHFNVGVASEGSDVCFDTVIELVEPMGADTLVWASFSGQTLRFRMDGQADVSPGMTVPVGFNLQRSSLFDLETEIRL